MKLIIDIDEDVRIAISRMGLLRIPDEMQKKVDKAIQRGTPVPKGHGKLVDADKTIADAYEVYSAFGTPCIITSDQMYAIRKVLTAAQAIIEADPESEDKNE